MKFWIGQIITLAAGLIAIGIVQNLIKRKWPAIRQSHFELFLIPLLCFGLLVSAWEHLASEAEIDALKAQASSIKSMEVLIRAQVQGDWTKGHPPDGSPGPFEYSKPVAAIDLRTSSTPSRRVEIFPIVPSSIESFDTTSAEVRVHGRVKSGDWLIGQQLNTLIGVERIEIIERIESDVWGFSRYLTKDGHITLSQAIVEIFINGEIFHAIRKQNSDLLNLTGRDGSFTWQGFEAFRSRP